MTPTFIGRIQTRLLLLATVGVVWTICIGPFLPAEGAALSDVYELTFEALLIVAVVGSFFWEPIYHLLQQLRWEKDWPTGLGLVTGLSEGLVTWFVISSDQAVPVGAFVVHFATTWIVVWCFLHGPLRIVLLRWRFSGGRIL